MLEMYKIQIFEVINIKDKIFKKNLKPILDTSTILNLSDHKNIINTVVDIFRKEKIDNEDKKFLIHVNIDEQFAASNNGVTYLFTYDVYGNLPRIEYQMNYFKKMITVTL